MKLEIRDGLFYDVDALRYLSTGNLATSYDSYITESIIHELLSKKSNNGNSEPVLVLEDLSRSELEEKLDKILHSSLIYLETDERYGSTVELLSTKVDKSRLLKTKIFFTVKFEDGKIFEDIESGYFSTRELLFSDNRYIISGMYNTAVKETKKLTIKLNFIYRALNSNAKVLFKAGLIEFVDNFFVEVTTGIRLHTTDYHNLDSVSSLTPQELWLDNRQAVIENFNKLSNHRYVYETEYTAAKEMFAALFA